MAIKVLEGILWALLGQFLLFYQLQGQFLYEFHRKHPYLIALLGVPISYLFLNSARCLVTAFEGKLWPSRLMGFGIGVIVFAIMAAVLFKEPITLKTGLCLLLGVLIVFIQVIF